MVRGPRGAQEHCALVHVSTNAVLVRFPDGGECAFKRRAQKKGEIGRPTRDFEVVWAGWYLPAFEIDRVALEHITQDQARTRPNVARQITNALLARCPLGGQWWKAFEQVSTRLGDQRRRMDIVHLETCQPGRIVATEVKSCRADFASDTKWVTYMGLVHAFYFAAPAGIIAPRELPAAVGLLEWDGLELRQVRAPAVLDSLPLAVLAELYRGCALAGSREGG